MMSFLSKVRILPLTIFAATLLLTIKIGDIWHEVEDGVPASFQVSRVAAQESNSAQTPPTTAEASDSLTPAFENETASIAEEQDPNAPSGDDLLEQVEVDPFAFSTGEIAAEAERIATQDPTLLSEQEIALLQKLGDRRAELDAREQDLEQRLGLLSAAETRIDNKIQQLRDLKASIDDLIITYDDQQETKTQSLVKIYENMKPKDAARIFEELDMDTLLLVAERMKERSLAPIMAEMNPQKARDVTVELSKLRDLPSSAGEPTVEG